MNLVSGFQSPFGGNTPPMENSIASPFTAAFPVYQLPGNNTANSQLTISPVATPAVVTPTAISTNTNSLSTLFTGENIFIYAIVGFAIYWFFIR